MTMYKQSHLKICNKTVPNHQQELVVSFIMCLPYKLFKKKNSRMHLIVRHIAYKKNWQWARALSLHEYSLK